VTGYLERFNFFFKTMKLSIIMPVHNERATIEEIIAKVRQVPLSKELIIVDDCSTDGTRSLLRKYEKEKEVTLIFHSRNRGKGRAIRTGLEKTSGEVVVVQDADLEYDPQDLQELIKPIQEGKARVVYGSRRLNSTNTQHSGLSYYIGGILVTYLARWLYRLKITDEATCYKMLETGLIKSLNLQCERFEFCPEVTAKLAKRKIPILELPISYYPRHKKEGKKINWRDGLEAIWTLVKYKFKY
jgi:glycosyltransferase involved in cell wall biosynthesis